MKYAQHLLFCSLMGTLLFVLAGCSSTGAQVDDQNYSLAGIRKSIVAVIGEPRAVSSNQRIYTSQYFGRKSDKKFNPEKSKIRQYTQISIMGDRRPYDVGVDVIVEQKQGDEYSQIGTDDKEAKELATQLRQKLHQSLDDRNVIDSFRVF
ncbi:MAG: hypothetical protein COT73_10840 [Bdellovibrio sp. CG10_big_fil_rev_8_21_14_0_10_47_8]|nr:MAG: hypothetical protein COT73_10840 [Bdellovibrio sp. CG10_big_fil_rev_8_21_14_0_10_47_8]